MTVFRWTPSRSATDLWDDPPGRISIAAARRPGHVVYHAMDKADALRPTEVHNGQRATGSVSPANS